MNHTYRILTSHVQGTVFEELDDLYAQLVKLHLEEDGGGICWCRVYLTDAVNQWQAVCSHPIYKILQKGCVGYIEQPPLNGRRIAMLMDCAPVGSRLTVDRIGPDCVAYRCSREEGRTFFQSVRLTKEECHDSDTYQQTYKAFERHAALLREQGMTLRDNCLRTWIFVRNIDNNYVDVVRARNDFFKKEGLTSDTHFIASTGIGGNTAVKEANVAIDFYSREDVQQENVHYLQALDYLNPTYEYGVAFERGTRFDGHSFFISGTASIDKEGHCLYENDTHRQTERLLTNIDMLLRNGGATIADVRYFVIYLRDVADSRQVDEYMSRRFPNIPHIVTEARVCRTQWLIEMECFAEN